MWEFIADDPILKKERNLKKFILQICEFLREFLFPLIKNTNIISFYIFQGNIQRSREKKLSSIVHSWFFTNSFLQRVADMRRLCKEQFALANNRARNGLPCGRLIILHLKDLFTGAMKLIWNRPYNWTLEKCLSYN